MKIKVTSSRFLPVTSSYHKGLGKTTLFCVMEQAKCLRSDLVPEPQPGRF